MKQVVLPEGIFRQCSELSDEQASWLVNQQAIGDLFVAKKCETDSFRRLCKNLEEYFEQMGSPAVKALGPQREFDQQLDGAVRWKANPQTVAERGACFFSLLFTQSTQKIKIEQSSLNATGLLRQKQMTSEQLQYFRLFFGV